MPTETYHIPANPLEVAGGWSRRFMAIGGITAGEKLELSANPTEKWLTHPWPGHPDSERMCGPGGNGAHEHVICQGAEGCLVVYHANLMPGGAPENSYTLVAWFGANDSKLHFDQPGFYGVGPNDDHVGDNHGSLTVYATTTP